jgi:hypothetical protein
VGLISIFSILLFSILLFILIFLSPYFLYPKFTRNHSLSLQFTVWAAAIFLKLNFFYFTCQITKKPLFLKLPSYNHILKNIAI